MSKPLIAALVLGLALGILIILDALWLWIKWDMRKDLEDGDSR